MLAPVLLAVGVTVGAMYFFLRPKADAPAPGAANDVVRLPAELQADYFAMLNSPVASASGLDYVAAELDKYGYASEAAKTRAKAQSVRGQ